MHEIEKKLIELGVIDATIEKLDIDEWFENAKIQFFGKKESGLVTCHFLNCFSLNLSHDKSYSKGKNQEGKLDYKYFIQDVGVSEEDEFVTFSISAWPLDGRITCKKIEIKQKN
ncbi:hypothetical protein JYG23_04530 [Sedimentibacter sp. zth1]|uniref:hypothetical protein n=1 Tax=Sedimentibacter sp. zth1 TaxID=2816908 RepID=UPI001A939AB1|nr:hypothetical protein [Sedimentibacter sp. zth1]QSX06722.1 hypothetical protein JYG23_04530 [Sedimentibacter sp. zth1]